MQNEKFSELIKEIRKRNNLTQKDLADKYHVTYQAVSKWETGKNMPDITILKEISHDYNVSIDDILDGNLQKKKKSIKLYFYIIVILLLVFLILFFLLRQGDNGFESKIISSSCKDFNITGIVSYNSSKSLIYIPKIEYCGEKKNVLYKNINCTLYEKNGKITKEVSNYLYEDEITLDEFMQKVNFKVDNYLQVCKNYNENSLYLEIKAMDQNNEVFYHTIPLFLEKSCN